MVKCKNCGETFTSKYQMADTSVLHKPNTELNLSQDCPGCGQSFTYDKDDHFF